MNWKAKMQPIPSGSLFTISTGEYSDYTVGGVFRAKAEIDPEALRAEWLMAHPDQAQSYRFQDYKFLGWIASKGLLEPIDCIEWHLGGCSEADGMWVDPMRNDLAST
ncbi:MAG: hypothetical protein M0Z28_18225 [Rhodospirillales bacterium]|nr:hypothetical protein [Rhodospirillales bacterium]